MLSRVAERVYWAARYLERAEDSARLIDVQSQLLLDLPASTGIAWPHIVGIVGVGDAKLTRGRAAERDTLKLLLTDDRCASSISATIAMARENFRTTRDIVPTEAWQCVNELHIFARSQLRWAVGKRRRHEILSEIVARVQGVRGLLADTMSHGPAYQFFCVGTNLERADMCTRIIDVAVASLLQDPERLERFENTLWMSTLKSVSGYQMYRQYVRRRMRGADVLAFLFQDADFPRSIRHCLWQIEQCMARLPNGAALTKRLDTLVQTVTELTVGELDNAALHAEVDRFQVALADLNQQMSDTWFSPQN
ncbi:MAG: alpha-E domain-containing protein [Pseudomonadales bacterium]|nr:alpha-E domain-containing protein [Pseudomonadales bacterium]